MAECSPVSWTRWKTWRPGPSRLPAASVTVVSVNTEALTFSCPLNSIIQFNSRLRFYSHFLCVPLAFTENVVTHPDSYQNKPICTQSWRRLTGRSRSRLDGPYAPFVSSPSFSASICLLQLTRCVFNHSAFISVSLAEAFHPVRPFSAVLGVRYPAHPRRETQEAWNLSRGVRVRSSQPVCRHHSPVRSPAAAQRLPLTSSSTATTPLQISSICNWGVMYSSMKSSLNMLHSTCYLFPLNASFVSFQFQCCWCVDTMMLYLWTQIKTQQFIGITQTFFFI